MGNNEIIPSNIEMLKPQNWIQAGQDEQRALFSNVNPYRKRLLANKVTHQLIEQYELNFIAEEDYTNYLRQLSFRQSSVHTQFSKPFAQKYTSTPEFIYPIRYFVNKSKHQMCATVHTGYLYIDKVDLRLKEINDIPFPDLLYIYRAALNGFKFLYQKVGFFDIQEEMIFINRKGQAKVWINANLAKNYPNFQKNQRINRSVQGSKDGSAQSVYGSQADMIKNLIYMIQKNSDQYAQKGQIQLFSQFLAENNILDKLSFQHCLEQFGNYLNKNNLHCSDRMKSIPQLFSPQDHFNSNQTNYQQSHVNQITSHHLNQMKKKIQPLETIAENQHYRHIVSNSKGQNKSHESQIGFHDGQRDFQESIVSNFNPHKATVLRQQRHTPTLPLQSKTKNVIRPSRNTFKDLEKSPLSHHSNKQSNKQYENLQKSSNSSHVHYQTDNQKPNPTSSVAYGYQHNEREINIYGNTPHLFPSQNQIIPKNMAIHNQTQNNVHSKVSFVRPQFYQNQNMQKVFICSPPPSFRVMGGIKNSPGNSELAKNQGKNSINYQQQQPILMPHQPVMYQHQFTVHQLLMMNPNNQVPHFNKIPMYLPPKYPPHIPKYQSSQKTPEKSSASFDEKSETKQFREEQNISKSNIKYFTTKNSSYQLDDQIASDLQKFLGLKVK